MFRISGNISLEKPEIVLGEKFRLNVGNKKSGLSFIQCLRPLNNHQPYYYLHIINASWKLHFYFKINLTLLKVIIFKRANF